ncbi:phospholipid phosphatase-related protein type 3 isoform X1 [Syngnathus acus]|uniref:phospholipid phosphatase-related protein type 3 isoform X1 n=1 Tax=Syngnathus acus TaxID=161584 RepID=UPI001885C5A3|nr:phospholipid phosphatase-related protein type 3 isoform X1 [Syngnathus acus]
MMMSSPSDKIKKKWSKASLTLLPCFYFVELPIVASSMVSLYFLELTDMLRPPRLGFRCHDRDLSKPYVDGGDEMIPLLMLLSLAFAGPAASIMLVEAFLYLLQSRTTAQQAEGSIAAGGCNFNSFLRRTVRFVGLHPVDEPALLLSLLVGWAMSGVHVFGLCATALVTDIIQLSTGCHAPFFLTVCKPNYSHVSCETNTYITKDICSGHDRHAIAAARKSFPSQHATLSAFAAVYVSMYFNSTISERTKLLKPVLVFVFAIAAALSGLTQITQHRSHPADIYVGFLVGAFIAAYLVSFSRRVLHLGLLLPGHRLLAFAGLYWLLLAFAGLRWPLLATLLKLLILTQACHAVANFRSSDTPLALPPPPSLEDPLRALTERGHESVYNKGPASASESNDEIAASPGPLQREVASMASLKRASADVELRAPRSPMAKETMLTFSNTLPRTSIGVSDGTPGPTQPVQPLQQRPKTVHVPTDTVSSQRLLSEWKKRSAEMRAQSVRDDNELGEDGSDSGRDNRCSPVLAVSSGNASSNRNPTPPPGCAAKPVATPRAPQIQQAVAPPISPKSSLARAKWLAIREKAGMEALSGVAANHPRLLQVVAMSKQQGLLASLSSLEKCSESATACCSSSAAPCLHCRPAGEKQREAVVTVNAHTAHHPLAQTPPSPWEWAGPNLCDTYHLNGLQQGDPAACGSSFRQRRAGASYEPPAQFEALTDAQRKGMASRRKTALVLLERGAHLTNEENHLKSFQGRTMKDESSGFF